MLYFCNPLWVRVSTALFSAAHEKKIASPTVAQSTGFDRFRSFHIDWPVGLLLFFTASIVSIVDTVATFELGPAAPLYCLMAGLKNMFLRGCDVGGRLRH